ncbi:hypothetical protein AB4254_11640 [Vibrio breoganii]
MMLPNDDLAFLFSGTRRISDEVTVCQNGNIGETTFKSFNGDEWYHPVKYENNEHHISLVQCPPEQPIYFDGERAYKHEDAGRMRFRATMTTSYEDIKSHINTHADEVTATELLKTLGATDEHEGMPFFDKQNQFISIKNTDGALVAWMFVTLTASNQLELVTQSQRRHAIDLASTIHYFSVLPEHRNNGYTAILGRALAQIAQVNINKLKDDAGNRAAYFSYSQCTEAKHNHIDNIINFWFVTDISPLFDFLNTFPLERKLTCHQITLDNNINNDEENKCEQIEEECEDAA